MTHNDWERGKQLTVYNATKDQLKWMVEDRDSRIESLWKELEEEKKMNAMLLERIGNLMELLEGYKNNGELENQTEMAD